MLLWGVYAVAVQGIMLAKKTRIVGVTWVVSAIANLTLNIVLVPPVGILGAAIATVVAYLLAVGITIYYSRRELPFAVDWGFIAKSLVASGVMVVVVFVIAPEGTLWTVLTVACGVLVYAAIVLLLRGFERRELQFFRQFLFRR